MNNEHLFFYFSSRHEEISNTQWWCKLERVAHPPVPLSSTLVARCTCSFASSRHLDLRPTVDQTREFG